MPLLKTCTWPDGCDNVVEGATNYCGSHGHLLRKEARKEKAKEEKEVKKIIKRVSGNMSKRLAEYRRLKAEFIIGKTCPIYPHLPAIDVHHMKGRIGSLLLDQRFWLAVSRKGHMWIELHPTKARELGYSLDRQKIE